MKKNLPLLAYHRFLVPRSQRVRFPPARVQNQFSFYRAQEEGAYGLEDMPPPVYDPNHPPPPLYQPPQGASKVNPRQDYDRPPAGSPPQSAPRKHSAELPPRPAPRSWSSRINPFRK
ncbi:MAG: hypothetical protein MMC33_010441 [Icmadophila ericetorum]|nr:hypothetical protein [Icmadophila ericetorum]